MEHYQNLRYIFAASCWALAVLQSKQSVPVPAVVCCHLKLFLMLSEIFSDESGFASGQCFLYSSNKKCLLVFSCSLRRHLGQWNL